MLTLRNILTDMMHGAGSYFYWNLVLDETGTSHWNWKQNSLVTIDRTTKQVTYNPEFYALRHISSYVKPGAHRVAIYGSELNEAVAFRNPDGGIVIAATNSSPHPLHVVMSVGQKTATLDVPARSMNTLLLP